MGYLFSRNGEVPTAPPPHTHSLQLDLGHSSFTTCAVLGPCWESQPPQTNSTVPTLCCGMCNENNVHRQQSRGDSRYARGVGGEGVGERGARTL